MGLPSINISFISRAAASIERSQKGVVGIIVRDAKSNGEHDLTRAGQAPELGAENASYVDRAFLGYVNPPRKVVLYSMPSAAESLDEGLAYMATRAAEVDYLVGPPDMDAAEASEIALWIKEQRADGRKIKAVLPDCAADSEGVVNFTTEDIICGGEALTAAQFCSRIAGLIAGTPVNISCTYAALADVADIKRPTKDEADAAIDAGEFILFHDGAKVKVGRGVNSLLTTTEDKGQDFKKIKFIEAVDMINQDIHTTVQDVYFGKYANSYDNKCLLISAIGGYFSQMEREGVLDPGKSSIGINIDEQEVYLQQKGIDTSEMSEQDIKEANTGDKVLLSGAVKILDAIEDADLKIAV